VTAWLSSRSRLMYSRARQQRLPLSEPDRPASGMVTEDKDFMFALDLLLDPFIVVFMHTVTRSRGWHRRDRR
jgi:hypothetical protein